MTKEKFQGEITVASKIVDYLSSGLYESPSACLKELINNSFDADATEVKVFVKPDADRIIIADNGHGMTKNNFKQHFRMISESYKRVESGETKLGRPKIGKIGIGFIAANEICDVMELTSTTKNSDELLHVSINFSVMRKDPIKRKKDDGNIAKADYEGYTEKTKNVKESYTHVFLKEIRGDARDILAHGGTSNYTSGDKSLYGLKAETVCKLLQEAKIKSWSDFDSYSKTRLEVALNVPVKYHEDWIPNDAEDVVNRFEEKLKDYNFNLYFDNGEVRKPIVFNPSKQHFISPFTYSGENVNAEGYFYVQHGAIDPQELQGLLIRIRNSAVGNYDSNFMGFPSTRGKIFQQWISAEIYADDGLEDALNIDRRTLRVAFPAYVELQNAVHNHLDDLISRARKELYGAGSEKRKTKKANTIGGNIQSLTKEKKKIISKSSATAINKTWKEAKNNPATRKKLLKKYTVDEFYDIVIDVASQYLNKKMLDKFLKDITNRLKD